MLDDNDELLYIFEVVHKHKTSECNRPEPWFEIKTDELLLKNIDMNTITFHCNRNIYCSDCEVKKQEELQKEELKKMMKQAEYDEWLKNIEKKRLELEAQQLQKRNAKIAKILDEEEELEEQWQRSLKHISEHTKFNVEQIIGGGELIYCLTGLPNPLDYGIFRNVFKEML